jgi:hypothetical protein
MVFLWCHDIVEDILHYQRSKVIIARPSLYENAARRHGAQTPKVWGFERARKTRQKIPNFVKQENAPIRISGMKQENAPILIVSARVYHDGPGRLVIVETRLSDDPDDRTAYRFKSSEAAANFIRDVLCQEIPETTSFVLP